MTCLVPPEHVVLLAMPLPAASNSHTFGPWITAQLSQMIAANAGGVTDRCTQYTSASVGEARNPWIWVSGPVPTVVCAVDTRSPASGDSTQPWACAGTAASARP